MFSKMRAAKLLTVVSFVVMNAVNAQQPQFVPGQVVTRFSEGTPQREVVAQVSQTAPLDLSGLDNVIEELGGRLGVPLRLHHLGSGYWLTVEVDRVRMAEHMQSVLRSHDGVTNVDVMKSAGADSLRQFIVTADESSDLGRSIARQNRRALLQVVGAWGAAVGLALRYEVDDAHLVISVDWNAATVALVERFKSIPEIDAAQLNYRIGLNSTQ